MNRYLVVIFVFFLSLGSSAQPSTEVYLLDIEKKGENYTLSNPRNISKNPGYDNQPHFTPDGKAILFSSTFNDQTEVVRYDLTSGKKKRLTNSPDSEYSPTVTPDAQYFSTVILEKDGTQLLQKYLLKNPKKPEIIIPHLKVGYHVWVDENSLVTYVLGEPNTMIYSILGADDHFVVTESIGRSLHIIPGTKKVSFVHQLADDNWIIKSFDTESGELNKIFKTLPGSEHIAWHPDGVIFSGKKDLLYKFEPGKDEEWVQVQSLAKFGGKVISRLAFHKNGRQMAIVFDE